MIISSSLKGERCLLAGILILLFKYSVAQDRNCDFARTVEPDMEYYVFSPNHPKPYPRGVHCRWIATCPSGYNCRLNCTEVNLPKSPSCSLAMLLISKTGDPMLSSAEQYCGPGTLVAVSYKQTISIGLITSSKAPAGRFLCELTAQRSGGGGSESGTCNCGYKKVNRIVGGEETGVNEYTSMASLVDVRTYEVKCGAVIIDQNYVLTAAHCLSGHNTNTLGVIVGEHDITTGTDTTATQGFRIKRFIIHPQYKPSNYDYDIAILELQNSIVFGDRVGPVCLPFKFVKTDLTGLKVTMLGWGTTFPGGPKSNVLLKVGVNIVSQSSCRSSVPAVTAQQVCTFAPGKDACQDDSGGPVLYTDPATKRDYNIGIISYGMSCASKQPGINTRVPVLLDWILKNTSKAQYCRK